MQREKEYNTEDGDAPGRENVNTGFTQDDLEGILDSPVSRVDGETPFGNVSDSYISPGGEDEDDDDDDDDDMDDEEVDDVAVEKDGLADADPAVEDLNDDDLLLDDDDEEDDDEDDDIL